MMNTVRNTVAGSYNCLKLDTKAVAKEVAELLKDDYFMLSSPVSILLFIIPN